MSTITTYQWPTHLPRCSTFSVHAHDADGTSIDVFPTQAASYAACAFDGAMTLSITLPIPAEKAVLRPNSFGLATRANGNTLEIDFDQPRQVMIEVPGYPELFIYALPPETNIPERTDPSVRWFAAGQVYDIDRLIINDGETVYIEGGAVLRGRINAVHANNIRVCGRGVIDASHLPAHHDLRMLVFEGCENVEVEGIIATGTPEWNTVFGACKNVHVHHYQCIGWHVCSDGIDVVGSQDVLIEHCCIRANDDCIVVKSVDFSHRAHDAKIDWRGNVNNVLARNCVLYNAAAGNVMEIGFETRADTISNITFEDIDVIGAHGHGGVFTIHAGDRAHISNVLYKNIRLEHFFDKLVDFFIQHSRYSKMTSAAA